MLVKYNFNIMKNIYIGYRRASFIYILAVDGKIKVGRSNNITKRMAWYRTHFPGYKALHIAPVIDNKQDERELIDKLTNCVEGREWFEDNEYNRQIVSEYAELHSRFAPFMP